MRIITKYTPEFILKSKCAYMYLIKYPLFGLSYKFNNIILGEEVQKSVVSGSLILLLARVMMVSINSNWDGIE